MAGYYEIIYDFYFMAPKERQTGKHNPQFGQTIGFN